MSHVNILQGTRGLRRDSCICMVINLTQVTEARGNTISVLFRLTGIKPTVYGFSPHGRVDAIYSLTTIKYNALFFLQFDTTYPVIEGETLH